MKWCKIFFPHFLLWSHQFSALTPLKQPLNWSADHYYKTKMSNAVGGWGGTQIFSTFFTHPGWVKKVLKIWPLTKSGVITMLVLLHGL